MKAFQTVMCVLGVLLIPTLAQAVIVENLTTSTILFQDDYEYQAASTIAAVDTNPAGPFNPIAEVGTWSTHYNSHAKGVTNYAGSPDPGASSGSQYLRIFRDATFSTPEYFGQLASLPVAGDHLRLTTMVNRSGGGLNSISFGLNDVGDAMTAGATAMIMQDIGINSAPWGDGSTWYAYTGQGWASTGLPVAPAGTWQKVSLDYVVGDATFGMTVYSSASDMVGTSVSGLNSPPQSTGVVERFGVANGSYGITYYDSVNVMSVPEPTSFALLLAGLIGLLCYAWKKRK